MQVADLAANDEKLRNWFTYHAPTEEQKKSYEAIRNAAYSLGGIIMRETPAGADQTAALRKLREAVMTANQSIACGGK
jgi:hypothetical protein